MTGVGFFGVLLLWGALLAAILSAIERRFEWLAWAVALTGFVLLGGMWPPLSAVLWLPATTALVVILLRWFPRMAWVCAMAGSVATLGVAADLAREFPHQVGTFVYSEQVPWIPSMGISYCLGVDGPSLVLVLLATLLFPLAIAGAAHAMIDEPAQKTRPSAFLATMLLLETAILGSLMALDMMLFYLFWEAMLVPMALLIGVWGGPRRIYAAVKFFLFTMVGSLPMLLGILYLYQANHLSTHSYSMHLPALYGTRLTATEQFWLFIAFGLAFAVKLPLFPFHTWLPDAHTEAPTAGSVILAGILLKLGGYGFYRFAYPLFPLGAEALAPALLLLAAVGVIYGAMVSRAQDDMKRLVAFSSVSHMAFVMLGLASGTREGITGAFFGMVAHGLATGSLFLIVGMLYERTHSRAFSTYGGWGELMPSLSMATRVIILASCGVPGLAGFWGELLCLWGAFSRGGPASVAAIISLGGMVASAVYMLYFFERVMQGPVNAPPPEHPVADLDAWEKGTLAPLIVLTMLLGIFPSTLITPMRPAVEQLAGAIDQHIPYMVPQSSPTGPDAGADPAGVSPGVRSGVGGTAGR